MDDDELFLGPADEMMVTDDAIAVIAGLSAAEVPGVSGMSGGISGDFAKALGRTNLTRGVKAYTKDGATTIDLYVIIKYGYRIPDVAFEIQEHVKESVEFQTGVLAETVNIHVQGVDFTDEKEKEQTV